MKTRTFVLAWELGAGYGHLASLRLLAERLLAEEHRVILATRDSERAVSVFRNLRVQIVDAPRASHGRVVRRPDITCYADLLHNIGFGDAADLHASATQWVNIYRRFTPDVLVVDHAPTALLASRAVEVARVIMSDGFAFPPRSYPLAPFHANAKASEMRQSESHVLGCVNAALERLHVQPLTALNELYHQVDLVALSTFPQTDAFGPRKVPYLGAAHVDLGPSVSWPEGDGDRIFVYLKRCDGLAAVLEELAHRKLPAIVAIDAKGHLRVTLPTGAPIQIIAAPVQLSVLLDTCKMAIVHGGNGLTGRLLGQGIPIFAMPLTIEQSLIARRCQQLGVARVAHPNDNNAVRDMLGAALDDIPVLSRSAAAALPAFQQFDPKVAWTKFMKDLSALEPSCRAIGS